ncbi:MAG: NDP-sugar synthase [Actinobacteria bacterium]|nr:NDP-sugar synthase [Actinomycetota bacterium]
MAGERIMIMAAGKGTRLMPLTETIAKPMVPIVNRPVLEHLLNLVSSSGFKDVVINVHYLPDDIINHFGDGSELGVNIEYSREEKLMGTAGGVKKCEKFLGAGTFLVLSGDALTDVDLSKMLEFHRSKGALATIMVTPVEDTTSYGVVVSDAENRVTGFQEKPTEAEALSNLANSGIYVFEPEIFNYIPEEQPFDFGRELFPMLVERGEAVFAWKHNYYWNDVGSVYEYQKGNFDALEGRVRVKIPGVEIAKNIWVEKNTKLNKEVVMTPPICIGDHCVIEEGARLLGPVIVGPHTIVRAGAVLYKGIKWGRGYVGRDVSMVGSIVGEGSRIEQGAVLLDGVVLGGGTVVKEGIVVDPTVKVMPEIPEEENH